MIVVIPDCPFRRFNSDPFCAHEANTGRTITLRDCDSCSLPFPTDQAQLDSSITEPADPTEWPLLARIVRRLKNDTDIGVGDTIHRQLGLPGRWFETTMAALSIHCHCADRRAMLNARYPYGDSITP